MARANYTFEVLDQIIQIVDLDGETSVTNDLEAVLSEIGATVPDIASKRIIYCDSMGRWDGVRLDQHGRPDGFILLGFRWHSDAMKAARGGLWPPEGAKVMPV